MLIILLFCVFTTTQVVYLMAAVCIHSHKTTLTIFLLSYMRIIIPCIITKFLVLLRFHTLLEGLMLLSGIDMKIKYDEGFSNWVCNINENDPQE